MSWPGAGVDAGEGRADDSRLEIWLTMTSRRASAAVRASVPTGVAAIVTTRVAQLPVEVGVLGLQPLERPGLHRVGGVLPVLEVRVGERLRAAFCAASGLEAVYVMFRISVPIGLSTVRCSSSAGASAALVCSFFAASSATTVESSTLASVPAPTSSMRDWSNGPVRIGRITTDAWLAYCGPDHQTYTAANATTMTVASAIVRRRRRRIAQ